jgi:hypothetical protein
MPSPFPGMDPYLEPHWRDVHTRLVTYSADALNRILPDSLVARTEERVAVGSDSGDWRGLHPDVRVFSPPDARQSSSGGGAAIAVPFRLELEEEAATERFIRILDQSGQLVTVIEFISPTNKRRDGLEPYLNKRRELLSAGVNFVEVDLVREGNWRALLKPHRCPPQAVSAYRATVRIPPGSTAYLYPLPLRLPLIDIPVPLRTGDQPATLALQPLLDQVYVNGRYARTLDYSQECEASFDAEDQEWIQNHLSAVRDGTTTE